MDSVSGSAVRVQGDGLLLDATLVQPAVAGDEVRVAIRPHDLVVARGGQEANGRNVFEAKVSVVEYQGREFAVGVTTSTGKNLFVHSEYAPTPGETVTQVLDPARALVYRTSLAAVCAQEQELLQVRG